jgi:glycine C-acetyltransferase
MKSALQQMEQELEIIRQAGTWREERIITTPQRARIDTTGQPCVLNM